MSFGTGGKVFTSISTVGNSSGYSLLIQPDDKIVLAGSCAAGSSVYRFCAARYQKNGALDTAFGSAGIAFPTLTVLSRSDRLRTAALQADGRILLVGSCDLGTAAATDSMFCAARLNADGVLDASFGTLGGRMAYRMTSPGQSYATTAALQADGKILIAGTCVNSASDFCAIRFEGGPFGYTACSLDIDGDGQQNGSTDTTILARIGSGLRGSAVLAGLSFAPNAKRSTWPQVRDFLVKQCGMSLVQ